LCFKSFSHVRFLENKGQIPQPVQFYADLKGGTVFLENAGFRYVFHIPDTLVKTSHPVKHNSFPVKKYGDYTVSFLNSNIVKAHGAGRLPGLTNYYPGNDTSRWATGVRAFGGVYYPSLYRNIDLYAYSQNESMKYDLIVKPGALVSDIALSYEGVKALSVSKDGSLIVATGVNEVYEYPPYAYQIVDGDTVDVYCRYRLAGNTVSFVMGTYSHNDTLIIDPALIFSTYTGASADNWGSSATYDEDGNAYTSGVVQEGVLGYPVELGKLQFVHGGGHGTYKWDVGVMKVSNDGREQLYATYFGGNGSDCPHSMVVNGKNELIIFGSTGSSDLPGAINKFSGGPYVSVRSFLDFDNGADMFVAKLDRNGRLVRSEYLGGTGTDGVNFENGYTSQQTMMGTGGLYYNYGDWARGEVAVDKTNAIYIGCTTKSSDFPQSRNFYNAGADGVVMRIAPDLGLEWSRYIAGSKGDCIYSIDVDEDQNVYYAGGTESDDMPVSFNAYKNSFMGGTTDGFVGELDRSGNFVSQTYFGSAEYDQAYFVRTDKHQNVYIYGQTEAHNSELVYNAAYNIPNSGQFIAKFQNDLSALVWSTVFGTGNGKPNISPTAFSVDMCNRTYLSGSGREWVGFVPVGYVTGEYYGHIIEGTNGMEVTPNAYESKTDGMDFYIMVMLDDASALDYATFFGERKDFRYLLYNSGTGRYERNPDFNETCGHDHVDGGTSRFDREGNVYQSVCASCGGCQSFPVLPSDAVSTANASTNCNNAVAKFEIANDILVAKFDAYNNPCVDNEIIFVNKTNEDRFGAGVKYRWDFGDGTSSTLKSPPAHTYPAEGDYLVQLVAEEMSSCNLVDTVYDTVIVKNIDISVVLDTPRVCSGDTVLLGFPEFEDPDFVYSWTPALYLDDPSLSDPQAIVGASISYTIEAKTPYCSLDFTQRVDVLGSTLYPAIEVQSFSSTKKALCLGETAVLKATVQGGAERYDYHWSYDYDFTSRINADFSDSIISVDLPESDSIYLFVKGADCGGVGTANVFLPVASSFIIAGADKKEVCAKEMVNLAVEEIDQDPLVYSWTPLSQIVSNPNTDKVVAVVEEPTEFVAVGVDSSSCEYRTSVFVDVDSVPIRNVAVDSISCFNYSDGAIAFEIDGNPPYSFLWSDGVVADSARKRLAHGSYAVTITDALNCTNVEVFRLENPLELNLLIAVHDQRCDDVCNGSVVANYYGGTGALHFFADGEPSEDSLANLCAGTYVLRVEDNHNCSVRKNANVVLDVRLPYVYAYADTVELIKGQSIALHAAEDGKLSELVEYVWKPDLWLSDDVGPVVLATPEFDTVYSVVATDPFGCQNRDTVALGVQDYVCGNPFVFIPSAFSPNGDGNNDVFKVYSKVLDEFSIVVYNRWGQNVWSSTSPDGSWDGTFNGQELTPAVFDYYFEGTCLDGEKFTLKGNVTLLR